MYSMAFLLLSACSTAERAASDVAVAFSSAAFGDSEEGNWSKRLALVCENERAAGSELRAKSATLLDQSPTSVGSRPEFTVQSVVLSPEKDSGVVVVSAPVTTVNGDASSITNRLKVRKENGDWCVAPGWAEQSRLDVLADKIEHLSGSSIQALHDWNIESAKKSLSEAENLFTAMPDDPTDMYADYQRTRVKGILEQARTIVSAKANGWVGGRWVVSSEIDPMTDEKNVIAKLESTTGLPNTIGEEQPAHLIVRCKRNNLDVYIATGALLDADWQTKSVTGQFRFGKAEAARFAGGRSDDQKGVFFRNPREWLGQFSAHEAEVWSVELPILQRTAATTTFDLAGTSRALAAVPGNCK